MESARSPAQLYALIFGVVLVAAGILGFFYEASFAIGSSLASNDVLGILAVNGWHNLIHILTGAIGLAVAGSYGGARAYALIFGVVYVIVAILGFISFGGGGTESILQLVPVNTEDNILHLLIGVAGLGAYTATPSVQAPSTSAPA
jgi:uncharacterized protein DUF4383